MRVNHGCGSGGESAQETANLCPMGLTKIRRAITKRLRKTTIGTCAVFMVDNQLAKLKLVRGNIGSDSGMAHEGFKLDESLAYIDWVYGDYRNEAGIDRFYGMIAEVGPGDNCGVALRLVADGADQVDLVDRFYSKRDESKQSVIYRALIERDAIPGYAGKDLEE